jgi:nucleoside-diphosphate-sugar epimerase
MILVTGASGFVGTRVCEHLRLGLGLPVRALYHRPERAARVARLDVELVQGDLADARSIVRVVRGCDAVVHCAYGSEGTPRQRRRLTGEGTGTVARAARAAGITRFVHLSSVAVWGFDPGAGRLDETKPVKPTGHPYVDGKIDSEAAVRAALPTATILRPSNVWGPWAPAFTVAPVRALRDGAVALVGDGASSANLLYVDNLCHAILRALERDEANGATVVVSDGDAPTWRGIYEAYGRIGGWALRTAPAEALPKPSRARELVGVVAAHPAARAVARRAPARMTSRARAALAGASVFPAPELAALQRSRVTYDTALARRVLGYDAPVGFEQALRLTEEWLRFARLV